MRRIDVDAELKVGRSTYDSMANAGNRKRTASGRNGRSADGRENKTGRNKKGGKQFSIAAYHGTAIYEGTLPFDKFDWIRHQLEGEGAMIFGAGSYVTGSERIGRHYANVAKEVKEINDEGKEGEEYTINDIEVQEYIYRIREREKQLLVNIQTADNNAAVFGKDIDDELKNKIQSYVEDNYKEGLTYNKAMDDLGLNGGMSGIFLKNLIEKKFNEEQYNEIHKSDQELFEAEFGGRKKIVDREVYRYLYSVEIPDDDKTNYIQWDKKVDLSQNKH